MEEVRRGGSEREGGGSRGGYSSSRYRQGRVRGWRINTVEEGPEKILKARKVRMEKDE